MKFAVFTVSLPERTPEQAVSLLASAGYDGVEWRVTDQVADGGPPGFWANNRCTWPLATFTDDAARIRALTEGAGLTMPCVGTYVTCTALEAVERAMRGTAALGAPSLRINVPKYDGRGAYLPLRDEALRQYEKVAALARRYGVRALVEIHHNSLLPSASAAAAFLSHFDAREVGVIHDAGNMVHEGFEQYRLGLEVLGPYLGHVHLKSAQWRPTSRGSDGGPTWHAEWAPLDAGIVDVAALLTALGDVGYDGWLSFEDFSSAQAAAERLRSNLTYVKRVAAAATRA